MRDDRIKQLLHEIGTLVNIAQDKCEELAEVAPDAYDRLNYGDLSERLWGVGYDIDSNISHYLTKEGK